MGNIRVRAGRLHRQPHAPAVGTGCRADVQRNGTQSARRRSQGHHTRRSAVPAECVFCHGVAARGGTRGPDLTTGTRSHGGSDADLAKTISTGVPGTAMPPNKLTTDEIWQIVTYLRSLQQPVTAPVGDPKRGEALFFGPTGCASCRMVSGRGGRLGPELSTAGSGRSRAYLVESIREPSRQLTRNGAFGESVTLKYDTVTAVTTDGRTIVGVPMNDSLCS
jgi:mono/diheme cytochrome c family protein